MIQIQSFAVNYFGENTYILFDETKEAVIIDCGCLNSREFQLVTDFVARNQLVLKHHLCTHYHLDHLFGAEYVKTEYGLSPEVNQTDLEILPSINQQSQSFGLPREVKDPEIHTFLEEGDVVTFGHSELKVLAVPGHSPGSLAFYNKEKGCVFVGDAIFAGSIGRTDLWGGNTSQLIRSIKQSIFTLPEDTVIYPGHGPETNVGYEKKNNPYIN